MQGATVNVKTIEVTRSVRVTLLRGAEVKGGQFISLLDGELDEAGESAVQALSATLQKLAPTAGQIVTLYRGKEVSEADAAQVADTIRARFHGVELQMVYGGQPLYHYIASLE
jgi:dihydroxyacetone kinase-like predicted kinase